MKIKLLLLALFTIATSAFAVSKEVKLAKGEALYLQAFSRIDDIIAIRRAETLALKEALSAIKTDCGHEHFLLLTDPLFKLDNSPIMSASLEYTCE